MTAARPSKTAVRRAAILEAAQAGEVSTAVLSARFGVTESTIRRDLAMLAESGKVARTYGGITMARSAMELDTSRKARHAPLEKQAIARAAAETVSSGDVIVIDAGTTAGQFAWVVRDIPGLTVVTCGMNALLALHDSDDVELIVMGGRLRHVNQGMVGPLAEQGLAYVSADRVYLGAEGLDPVSGISCPTLEQATLKTAMIDRAREVYVLADASKMGRRPFSFWTRLPEHVRIITAGEADADLLEQFRKHWDVQVAASTPGAGEEAAG